MNATDTIRIDFGHRAVDITIEDVRSWRPWTDESITNACRALKLKATHPGARDAAVAIINDVAAQTRGCDKHECISCGGQSYGSDAGHDMCGPCFELGGIDNQLNDDGVTEVSPEEMAVIRGYCDEIQASGGFPLKALATCTYITSASVSA